MALSPCADKGYSGYVPSQCLNLPASPCWNKENYPPGLSGRKDSKSLEMLADTCIGSSSSLPARRLLWPASSRSLAQVAGVSMPNCPDLNMQPPTVVKRTQESWGHGNGDLNPFDEIPRSIGNPYGVPPSPEILTRSPRVYEWLVIGPFELLGQTSYRLGLLSERYLSSGVERRLVNLGELGMKPEWTLILSVREASSGMVIKVKRILLSTSFEAESIFPMFCDGVIGIRSVWKLKDQVDHWTPNVYGSLPMLIPEIGTQI